jgi:oligopeptide/dipeptide ABC transporter ATP-binding protein
MMHPVLELRGVSTVYDGAQKSITRSVDMTLHRGRTLALVGESGCGKSVTALSIINLLSPPLTIGAGEILLHDEDGTRDIARLDPSSRAMRDIRGRRIAMIFQDPMTALDPVYTVGDQISEMLRRHLSISRNDALTRAVALLRQVGIPAPEARIHDYPFQLSGGMRQRVMIAIAIACSPSVLIADEPTTALDVTVQAQILDLLRELNDTLGMATLLITHDLGVVAENADDVMVMYRGEVVERASVERLFELPAHPYTRGLLASIPSIEGRSIALTPIPGQVPPIDADVAGCPFADRCPHMMAICRERMPPLQAISDDQAAACWLHVGTGEVGA